MKAKKNLGQNFLIDQNIIKKIGNTLNVDKDDLIIEIGPGQGALTKYLHALGANLICYEIDTDMIPYLSIYNDNKTKIIYKDILDADIKKDIESISYKNLYIIGNLPYYITTPIIKHLIQEEVNAKEMIFMVQEEVADRFAALPGTKNYSSITLYLKYFYTIEKLFKVSKHCFNPVPKVESAVIKFTKRVDKPNVNREKYFKLLNDSFKMKRKTLKNNLKDYNFNTINEVLDKYNLDDTIRAEELDEKVFIDICNNL